MTYQSAHLTSLLELTEEGHLQLALSIVVGVERLEDSVQALKEECPEIVKWAKVTCTISNISRVMVVWLDNTRSIELGIIIVNTVGDYTQACGLTGRSSVQYSHMSCSVRSMSESVSRQWISS
jgi:hypothetical protein